jgi:hypothetical protein
MICVYPCENFAFGQQQLLRFYITARAEELIKLGVVNISRLNKGAFYNLDVNVAWANVLITPGEWRYWGT